MKLEHFLVPITYLLLTGSAQAFIEPLPGVARIRDERVKASSFSFLLPEINIVTRSSSFLSMNKDPMEESRILLEKAKAIRDSLPQEAKTETASPPLKSDDEKDDTFPTVDYRLYIDIGREEGTWMEPRWAASGNRLEFTMDVSLVLPNLNSTTNIDESLADPTLVSQMVKDNLSGKSSQVRILRSKAARLRSGFDKMKSNGGAYRIDATRNSGTSTARFYITVDGTPQGESNTYGDVSIPVGNLYFSLPCFGNSVTNFSSREGIVTVQQIGWHTGWRRSESRIIGVFRAVPLAKAMERDRF